MIVYPKSKELQRFNETIANSTFLEKRSDQMKFELRKVKLTIPQDVWGLVVEHNDVQNIDNLVTKLIIEHYE